MSQMKASTEGPPTAALLGDLIASRESTDRRRLHTLLLEALQEVNTRLEGDLVEPIRVTVGDEFQGRFHSVGAAVHASLLLRLSLAEDTDVRFGLGWGAVTVLDAAGAQDGPGWWAAREAIEWVARTQGQAALGSVRTAYRKADGVGGPDQSAVNAALQCRDHLVGSLDERSRRILAGLMGGLSQVEIAVAEGISASAVSQRVRRDGLGILVATAAELQGVR